MNYVIRFFQEMTEDYIDIVVLREEPFEQREEQSRNFVVPVHAA